MSCLESSAVNDICRSPARTEAQGMHLTWCIFIREKKKREIIIRTANLPQHLLLHVHVALLRPPHYNGPSAGMLQGMQVLLLPYGTHIHHFNSVLRKVSKKLRDSDCTTSPCYSSAQVIKVSCSLLLFWVTYNKLMTAAFFLLVWHKISGFLQVHYITTVFLANWHVLYFAAEFCYAHNLSENRPTAQQRLQNNVQKVCKFKKKSTNNRRLSYLTAADVRGRVCTLSKLAGQTPWHIKGSRSSSTLPGCNVLKTTKPSRAQEHSKRASVVLQDLLLPDLLLLWLFIFKNLNYKRDSQFSYAFSLTGFAVCSADPPIFL